MTNKSAPSRPHPSMPAGGTSYAAAGERSALMRVTEADNVATARRRLADAFRGAGLDTPELDARVLVGHALGVDQATMFAAAERPLSAEEATAVTIAAQRRLAREPVARITARKEFWGLELSLAPATLVPRPDSETVVETALSVIDMGGSRHRSLKLADLGTGSGALLLALLSELPAAGGIGTDVSRLALAVARDNAVGLGLAEQAAFVACQFGAALTGGFDLVVCNPPYIRSGDIATLAPEVRDHDPRLALDGGPDGLACYRALARDAGRLLSPRGHLVVEVGKGAADPIVGLFDAAGLRIVAGRADLAGVARALAFAPAGCV